MTLRFRLRAPLTAAVTAALVGGVLAAAPSAGAATPRPDRPGVSGPRAQHATKADVVASEAAAAQDGLTRSRVRFKRSSYLCVGYKACTAAGMSASGYASANDTMYWRMYAGHNCTNYAAYRMVRSGLPNVRPWTGGGNATYWGTSVPKLTDGTPRVGAVAWWKANVGPAGSAGHVAYVERVVSADEIVISQDSWGGDFSWAVVTKASGNWPSGFVHFNDADLLNTAAPVISGLPKVGGQLTATPGGWKPTDAKVSYQWFANGAPIPSATAPALTLDSTLLGQTISVQTTATKRGYPTAAVASAPTPAVLPGVLTSTQAPVVSGVVQVDKLLTLDPGAWNVAPDSTSVQWYADGQPIAGATGTTLRLTADLAGRAITVGITASRAGYDPAGVSTAPTAPVALGRIRVRAKPALSGDAKPTRTLTVATGGYRPAGTTVGVQWLRDGQPIPGATAASYQLTAADLGTRVAAAVTVTRAGYETVALSSPASVRVRDTAHVKIDRIRSKHGMRLVLQVKARYVPEVAGALVVRVHGMAVQRLTLRHGVARLRIRGLAAGLHTVKVTYRGSPTVAKAVRTSALRIR